MGQIVARMKFSESALPQTQTIIWDKNLVLHIPFIYTPWKKFVLECFELSLSHLGLVFSGTSQAGLNL